MLAVHVLSTIPLELTLPVQLPGALNIRALALRTWNAGTQCQPFLTEI